MSLEKLFLMILIYILIFSILCLISKSNNAMMLSAVIIFISLFSFFLMKMEMSMSLMPTVFCMLFSGGILILFMTLSSLMPNSEMKKMFIFNIPFLVFFLSLNEKMLFEMFELNNIKSIFYSSSFTFMILFTSTYFFSFVFILSSSKESMRSFFCYS